MGGGVSFDFTINIPIIISIVSSILGGFFVIGKWTAKISDALTRLNALTERLDDIVEIINEHDRSIIILETKVGGTRTPRRNLRRG